MAKLLDEKCNNEADGSDCQFLNESDVPGAALNGQKASSLTIPELKCWLQCRRAPTAGKKADLVSRLTYWLV